ncbi:hypothetical protein RYX45_19750, partial [Alkalihalophilus pseudofirmus]|nr:hypothetical protein [Alkalihalophilus pseudofirmus]
MASIDTPFLPAGQGGRSWTKKGGSDCTGMRKNKGERFEAAFWLQPMHRFYPQDKELQLDKERRNDSFRYEGAGGLTKRSAFCFV